MNYMRRLEYGKVFSMFVDDANPVSKDKNNEC